MRTLVACADMAYEHAGRGRHGLTPAVRELVGERVGDVVVVALLLRLESPLEFGL